MLLSKLKSTNDCIETGKALSENQIDELMYCRKACIKSSKKWLGLECYDIANIMAVKAQFCKEAIDVSEGTFNYG